MKKVLPLFFLFFLFLGNLLGQQDGIKKVAFTKENIPKFIVFNESGRYTFNKANRLFEEQLKLKEGDELRKISEKTDKIGFTHHVYQQYYKNIKVEYGTYKLHIKNNKIESANGEFYRVQLNTVSPSMSSPEAFDLLIKEINAKSYMWEDKLSSKEASYIQPEGELVIIPIEEKNQDNYSYALAYKFDIFTREPYNRADYFIDAISGKIVEIEQTICTGEAETIYSGTKTITTQSVDGGFRLFDPSRGSGIHVTNTSLEEYIDDDDNWAAAEWNNSTSDQAALDALWGLEMTYDYFLENHDRNSYDDNGALIKAYLTSADNPFINNASWNGERILFGVGDGDNYNPFSCIDIMGHEYGHAIDAHSSNLKYEDESGALDEGLCDIWGACVTNYAAPEKEVWYHGEEYTINQYASRDLSYPNGVIGHPEGQLQRPSPDTYNGNHWATGDEDNGGVHTNSGVLGHWFYLLTEGSRLTDEVNDNGDGFYVFGIGIEDAARIVYRMETIYLSSNSGYNDARNYGIQAAINLFGECSIQHISTQNAFHAVGLGSKHLDCCPTNETDFHFEHLDGSEDVIFSICEDVYLEFDQVADYARAYAIELYKQEEDGSTSFFTSIDLAPLDIGDFDGLINITDFFSDPSNSMPIEFEEEATYLIRLVIDFACERLSFVHSFTLTEDLLVEMLHNQEGVLVLTEGNYYNYGDPLKIALINFEVDAGGLLVVNQSGGTGYNGIGPVANSGNIFSIYSGGGGEGNCSYDYIFSDVVVKNKGEFKIQNGLVHILKGSEVRIQAGGLLKVVGGSKLIIHPGASLIIEDGADIALWDGQGVNGRASIEFQGTLEVQGDFNFSGNGCFRFHPGNQVSLTGQNKFRLRGENQDWRFIEVMNGATLNTSNGKLRLIGGTVELNETGKIKAGAGGNVSFSKLNLNGGLVEADGSNYFALINSNINNSDIYLKNISDIHPLNITLSKSLFNNSYLTTSDCGIAKILNCEFDLSGGFYLAFENTGSVRLNESKVFSAEYQAIFLEGQVPEFVMSGGSIFDNYIGIWANDTGDGGKVNIFLRKKAEIRDNNTGILFQEPDFFDSFHEDSRLVLADCARLIDNDIAIQGKDVLLQIDAYENSATTTTAYLRPNHFQNKASGLLFDICYANRDITAISAKGNYWGTNNATIENLDQSQWQNVKTSCISNYLIDIDISNKASSASDKCPSKPDDTVVIELPDDRKCELSIDEIQMLPGSMGVYAPEVTGTDETDMTHDQLAVAFESFNVKLEVDEKTDEAKALFAQVANISDQQRGASSNVCKQNIDVARIMVATLASSQNLTSPNNSENALPLNQGIADSEKILDNPLIKVFPNPANNQLNVHLQTGNYHLQLSDFMGRIFYAEYIESTVKINTEKMNLGVYILKVINLDTNEKEMRKIILQR